MTSGNETAGAAPAVVNAKFNPSMAIIIVVLIGACLVVAIFSTYLKKCMPGGGNDETRSVARRNQSIRFYDGPGEGLDRAVIDSLPTVSFSVVKTLKHGKEDLECAVCLESFEDDEPLRLLPKCSHVFHTDCIDAWFLSHSTCPLCRISLKAPDGVGEVSRRILEAQEELLFSSARMGSDIGTVIGDGEVVGDDSGRDIDGESERDSARYAMLRKLYQNSNSFQRAARGVKIQERVMALSARYPSTDHVPETPQGCIHLSLQRTTSRQSALDFYSNSLSYRSSLSRPGSLNEREMSRSSFGRLGSLNERETLDEEEGVETTREGVEPSLVSSDTGVLLEKPQSRKSAGAWEQRVRREGGSLRPFSRSASEGRRHMFEMEDGNTLAQRTMQWLSGANRSGPLERRNDQMQEIVTE